MAEYVNEADVIAKSVYRSDWAHRYDRCVYAEDIADIPTIDIVHCAECIHHINHCCYNRKAYHMRLGTWTVDDYFCADGERN